MLHFNERSFSLEPVENPSLYRDLFPYDEVPKISFNWRKVPMRPASKIWIDQQYAAGRTTSISDSEMKELTLRYFEQE